MADLNDVFASDVFAMLFFNSIIVLNDIDEDLLSNNLIVCVLTKDAFSEA